MFTVSLTNSNSNGSRPWGPGKQSTCRQGWARAAGPLQLPRVLASPSLIQLLTPRTHLHPCITPSCIQALTPSPPAMLSAKCGLTRCRREPLGEKSRGSEGSSQQRQANAVMKGGHRRGPRNSRVSDREVDFHATREGTTDAEANCTLSAGGPALVRNSLPGGTELGGVPFTAPFEH